MWWLGVVIILLLVCLLLWFWRDVDAMMFLSTFIRRRRFQVMESNKRDDIALVSGDKVCLVSGSISPPNKRRAYASISKQRLEAYAQQHNYKLSYFTDYYDSTAPPIWQKVYAVREALQDNSNQVVVWLDDDIYITNPRITIESFIKRSNKPIILSEDMISSLHRIFPSLCWNFINTGIFILHNTPLVREFIDEVIEGRLHLQDGYWNLHNFHEQSVITYLVMTKYYNHCCVLQAGVMQSYSLDKSWCEGDFILHLAGESLTRRNEVMTDLMLREDSTKCAAV